MNAEYTNSPAVIESQPASVESYRVTTPSGTYSVQADTWIVDDGLKFKIGEKVVAWFLAWENFRLVTENEP